MNEQELAAEIYVKAFLTENGLSTNFRTNISYSFLLRIYNGLIIADRSLGIGMPRGYLTQTAKKISVYIEARRRMFEDISKKNLEI